MNTTSSETNELMPLPELEEIPTVRNFDVVARLKKSSKYYEQGLDQNSKPRFFRLEYFMPSRFGLALSRDAYILHFNGNAYRIEDCELFLCDPKNPKSFIRIV